MNQIRCSWRYCTSASSKLKDCRLTLKEETGSERNTWRSLASQCFLPGVNFTDWLHESLLYAKARMGIDLELWVVLYTEPWPCEAADWSTFWDSKVMSGTNLRPYIQHVYVTNPLCQMLPQVRLQRRRVDQYDRSGSPHAQDARGVGIRSHRSG